MRGVAVHKGFSRLTPRGSCATLTPVSLVSRASTRRNDRLSLSKETKREIVKRFETHSGDTGSAEVQIALLTTRIETLSQHFEMHKKDNHSRLGLLKMVGKRRRLLNYLKDQKPDSYKLVIKELGLRR